MNNTIQISYIAKTFTEPCQTSKMEIFVKIVNAWSRQFFFPESSILEVWQGFENASVLINVSSFF